MLEELFNEFNLIFTPRSGQVNTYKDPFGRGTWRISSSTDALGNYSETRTLTVDAEPSIQEVIDIQSKCVLNINTKIGSASYDMKQAAREENYEKALRLQKFVRELKAELDHAETTLQNTLNSQAEPEGEAVTDDICDDSSCGCS